MTQSSATARLPMEAFLQAMSSEQIAAMLEKKKEMERLGTAPAIKPGTVVASSSSLDAPVKPERRVTQVDRLPEIAEVAMSQPLMNANIEGKKDDKFVQAVNAAVPSSSPRSSLPPPSVRQPLVTALMVINDPRRVKHARQAVECFLKQVYPRKQLLIINGIDPVPEVVSGTDEAGKPYEVALPTSVTTRDHPEIIEQRVPFASYGAMRNEGLKTATGEYIANWEDDEHSHPMRLLYQMANRVDSLPVMLKRQVRINIKTSTIFLHEDENGISSTMIHVRSHQRYDENAADELTEFWKKHASHKRVVLDNAPLAAAPGVFVNDVLPAHLLSTGFYYGRNRQPLEDFMGSHNGPEFHGYCGFGDVDVAYLIALCDTYGLGMKATKRVADETDLVAGAKTAPVG